MSRQNNCTLNDNQAHQVEAVWKQAFSDAFLLPVIGLPSNSDGVLTLTHTDGSGKVMKINGLPSRSPLANNALYSSECINGKYLNLYEIMIPDIPGDDGEDSTAEFYVKQLWQQGLHVAGVHFHWTGSSIFDSQNNNRVDRGVIAVHHQMSDMNPIEFSQKTIIALKTVMKLIDQRSKQKSQNFNNRNEYNYEDYSHGKDTYNNDYRDYEDYRKHRRNYRNDNYWSK